MIDADHFMTARLFQTSSFVWFSKRNKHSANRSVEMILFTCLLLALVVNCSQATPGCMAGDVETAMLECTVEDIVSTIIENADYSALLGEGENAIDIGDADIASRFGKANYLAQILLALESPVSNCEATVSDVTGNEEDNEIEDAVEEVNEPDIADEHHETDDEGQEHVDQNQNTEQDGEDEEETEETERDPECYTREDGGDYFGTISVTESGLTCQRWSERTPHRPVKKYRGYGNNILFPAYFGDHNYCRTLGNTAPVTPRQSSRRSRPWCHTMDPEVRWEYCDVPAPSESC
ncbi:uncharacterized protein LOC117112709 [Anneissia japonica]|uniref:uncharacterized protein LOC117112709 n=1 Tax=Anneissia japonica TaxID=1529436 RepID=UPI0014254BC7|nr:uncharacterized protein LOC117112709 [Anneissia japonica]